MAAGPWDIAPESAETIAHELVADLGWWPAVQWTVGRMLGTGSWPRARQAIRLLAAVVRHG